MIRISARYCLLLFLLLAGFFGQHAYSQESTVAEAQTIARLYSASLNRPPLLGGLNFFINSLESGRTVISIAEDFVLSPEFVTRYGELDDRAYVERLFLNVLDRPGAEGGIQFWVGNLADGNSRAFVLTEFADSTENIANTAFLYDSMAFIDGRWEYDLTAGMEPSATLELPSTLTGFDNIIIVPTDVEADAGSYQVFADIGGGVVLDLPHRLLQDGKLEFTSPPGVFGAETLATALQEVETNANNTVLKRGNVRVGVRYLKDGEQRELDAGEYEAPGLPTTPDGWPPGTATLLLLQAIGFLPEDTFTNLGIANTNADNGLSVTQTNTLSRRLYAFIDQLNAVKALVETALAGDTTTLSDLSSSIVAEFSMASVEALDQFSFQLLDGFTDIDEQVRRSSVAGNPELAGFKSDRSATLETESEPQDILVTLDIRDLANQLSTSFANNSDKFGQIAEVTSALVTSTTTVSGSGVASSEDLGAIALFIPTMLGTTLATVVDDSSTAILDGESQLEVSQASAQNFTAQYLDPIADDLANADVAEVVGSIAGGVTNEGIASFKRLDEFVQDRALPAYGAGELPAEGIPESPFEITSIIPIRFPNAVLFNYSITVSISPAPDRSQEFIIEIASLDNSVSDQSRAITSFNGRIMSEWTITPPGIYRLSVFTVGGRAASSRLVSFF